VEGRIVAFQKNNLRKGGVSPALIWLSSEMRLIPAIEFPLQLDSGYLHDHLIF
jgi:hypothetical protein